MHFAESPWAGSRLGVECKDALSIGVMRRRKSLPPLWNARSAGVPPASPQRRAAKRAGCPRSKERSPVSGDENALTEAILVPDPARPSMEGVENRQIRPDGHC